MPVDERGVAGGVPFGVLSGWADSAIIRSGWCVRGCRAQATAHMRDRVRGYEVRFAPVDAFGRRCVSYKPTDRVASRSRLEFGRAPAKALEQIQVQLADLPALAALADSARYAVEATLLCAQELAEQMLIP